MSNLVDGIKSPLIVFTLSDSSGETAEAVSKAALAQFHHEHVQLYRLARVSSIEELNKVVSEISKQKALIAYTLVRQDLKEALEKAAASCSIPIIDLLGPLITKVAQVTQISPLSQAGRLHLLDESYYKRIEAIDFVIRYDDGKNPNGLTEADVILIGVSRTSKTPNCMYLAQHWGLKAANIPLVPGLEAPPKLFTLSEKKIVGLTINPQILAGIRSARANVLGLPGGTDYTDLSVIEEEVKSAKKIFRRLGCHTIDVSNKAIEETSGEIFLYLRK
jgi:[pyruvate, water dikinase]-phosphate phosphotransferase / [pyruvate, water dikinase] kinase